MKKRMLAMLLTVCMVLSILPAAAFAANTALPFTDVKAGQWFYDDVAYVYEKDMMKGMSDTTFEPNTTTSRGMIVTILHRLEGTPVAKTAGTFTDVAKNQWYADAVDWAAESQIVNGYGNGKFGPGDTITRQQMAAILYRYADYKGYDVSKTNALDKYTDAGKIDSYARTAMEWANAQGLITGETATTLNPTGGATRAQAAAILRRFCEKVAGSGEKPEKPAEPVGPAPSTPTTPSSGNKHQVSFLLNDGSDGIFATQEVFTNKKAADPGIPERNLYGFTGWFTDSETTNSFDFSTPITEDLVLYAGWGAPDGSDSLYAAEDKSETIYSVTGIEVVANRVNVTINTNSACAVVVQFLDEETEDVLATVAAQTPDYCELEAVSIPIDAKLPEHYLVSAVLVDENQNELCNPYKCNSYTSVYKEFAKKTTDDFEGQEIINFDRDTSDNFGVLADDVKIITSSDIANTMEAREIEVESKIIPDFEYIFSNADTDVASLAVGDKVYVNGTAYLFKISEIENNDGVITIKPDKDTELTEFYSFLKVDMSPAEEDAPEPQSEIEQIDNETSITAERMKLELIDVDTTLTRSIKEALNWTSPRHDWLSVSGEVEGSVKLTIKMVWDAHLFSEDYFSCSIISETDIKVGVTATVSRDNGDSVKDELKLCKMPFPTPVPGLTVYVAPTVPFEWKASASGSLEYTNKTTSGFKYDTDSGKHPVEKKESTLKINVEGKIAAKIGPKLSVGIEFIGDTVSAELGIQGGIEATATASVADDSIEITNADSKHACGLCIDGEAKWFVEAKAKLSVDIVKDVLDFEVFNITLFRVDKPFEFSPKIPGKFYISILNNANSPLGGRLRFGGGSCPNKSWRTTIVASDASGNDRSDIDVTLKKEGSNFTASGKTKYQSYLYKGVYTASCTIDGVSVNKSFVVDEAAQEILLTPNSEDGRIVGTVWDANNNSAIVGAVVTISKDLSTITTKHTSLNGEFSATVPDGTYCVSVAKDGYMSATSHVTVRNGQTSYMETIKLPKSLLTGQTGMGGFSGQITDAVTGRPIEDVELILRSGGSDAGNGRVLKTLKTDANGQYLCPAVELFGVLLGLPGGNYTMTATKEGYVETDFNVMILPGVANNPNQNASISPVGSEGEYRIVLTWEAIPRDLDSHVVGPLSNERSFHVYYRYKSQNDENAQVCKLDRDVTSGKGPETITLNPTLDKPYYYYIHQYSDDRSIAQSNAQIKVYKGGILIGTYNAPTNQGSSRYWNVFAIINGQVVTKNTITSAPDTTYTDEVQEAVA